MKIKRNLWVLLLVWSIFFPVEAKAVDILSPMLLTNVHDEKGNPVNDKEFDTYVSIKRGGKLPPPRKNMELKNGDKIVSKKDGSITIWIKNTGILRLKEESEVDFPIDHKNPHIVKGGALFEIEKNFTGLFSVFTLYVKACVHGTIFEITVKEDIKSADIVVIDDGKVTAEFRNPERSEFPTPKRSAVTLDRDLALVDGKILKASDSVVIAKRTNTESWLAKVKGEKKPIMVAKTLPPLPKGKKLFEEEKAASIETAYVRPISSYPGKGERGFFTGKRGFRSDIIKKEEVERKREITLTIENADLDTSGGRGISGLAKDYLWKLQIGSFTSDIGADSQLQRIKDLNLSLLNNRDARITVFSYRSKLFNRLRVLGLTKAEAWILSQELEKNKIKCWIIPPGSPHY